MYTCIPYPVYFGYKHRQVGNVVFIEGLVFFKGRWLLYYGTADSKIAVAEAVGYDYRGLRLPLHDTVGVGVRVQDMEQERQLQDRQLQLQLREQQGQLRGQE
jgi:hypothetical protein